MNILLTNDDGYNMTGIKVVFDILSKKHNVVIVAPNEVMSAKSVSIVICRPIEVKKISENIYSCTGTPADCVSFGLSSLNTKFDLVISGCNHGLNISYDTMYSGTIGACLQALTYRVPAIALSCEHNFEIVEKYLDSVLDYINDNNLLSIDYLLSVNFPLGDYSLGIKMTHVYYREEVTYFTKTGENQYLAIRDINDKKCNDIESDVYAVYHHYISITKMKKTFDI
jgi:5'-nucleotidase